MIRRIHILVFMCLGVFSSHTALASSPRVSHALISPTGAVCAGPNSSKGLSAGRFEIKVGNNSPVLFEKWQWIARNLDIKSSHLVVVLKDKKPVASWKLNFSKSNFMVIWRDATTWHMKAIREVCGL